jgi:putative ABC transport system permease protein
LLFIIGTMMVGRQIRYMLNTDLGFNKDAIVTIDIPWGQPNNQKHVLATEIRHLAGVRQVSLNTADPQSLDHEFFGMHLDYNGPTDVSIAPGGDNIDTGYISLYGLTLVAGRNFYLSDTARKSLPAAGSAPAQPGYRAYILNESAARALGFNRPADAIGKLMINGPVVSGPVIGVVKDFHLDDMHQKIRPFIFWTVAGAGTQLSVKLSSAGLSGAGVKTLMTNMESVFKKIYPETAFTANQRTREIGIRKVLGAGVPQLVSMLSGEFVLLVGISTVIAAPVAGWGVYEWLRNFAYRTSMPWWIFVLAGVAAMMIALLTVSLQTIRAATANPVRSLRVE